MPASQGIILEVLRGSTFPPSSKCPTATLGIGRDCSIWSENGLRTIKGQALTLKRVNTSTARQLETRRTFHIVGV